MTKTLITTIALVFVAVIGFARITPAAQSAATKGVSNQRSYSTRSVPTGRTAGYDDPYSEFRHVNYSKGQILSASDEAKLGRQVHLEVQKKFKLTSEGAERVNRIGQRVARFSLRPTLNYHFFVVNQKEVNAFSGPAGYVYVTTGLLRIADDDELAAVLAHEIGHVVAQHSLKSIQQNQELTSLAEWFGSITGIAGKTAEELGKSAAILVGRGFLTVHSRDEEREADYLGVHFASAAGYRPEGMVTMFRKLQKLSKDDAGILGSIFSDHPDTQERIDNTQYEISRMKRAA